MKILILSPHFPPSNAADMHRVRMILPHLAQAGVHAEVLAVEAEQVASPRDRWLEAGLPEDLLVHRVKALGLGWGRIPGFGTLSLRAIRALRLRGNQLLGGMASRADCQVQQFDLIYFSTTQFGTLLLGPYWKRKFGVPFVIDYQDPWVNDYYSDHPEIMPPGGRMKYGIASWLARRQEPRVLRSVSGITSVSRAYPKQLQARYSWLRLNTAQGEDQYSNMNLVSAEDGSCSSFSLDSLPCIIMPFPGSRDDLERVRRDKMESIHHFSPDDFCHWVYVGRGGSDMAKSVRALFRALASMPEEKVSSLRLHFIGTSYAAVGKGEKSIEPIAAEFGLEKNVSEASGRIRYQDALRCLIAADALIVPGSDDPGYTASKIYPYLLTEKPLLAVFHEKSSVVDLMNRVGGGTLATFSVETSEEALSEKIRELFSDDFPMLPKEALQNEQIEPFLAPAQARKLADFFHDCLECESKREGGVSK